MVRPATQRETHSVARRVASVPLARLERVCVVLLIIAALLPRLRDIAAEFDRGVDGEQGAFFAVAALNYERGDAAGAYPVLNLEPAPRPEQRLVYAHHPPLVPLLAWNAVRVLGPAGWKNAWVDGAPPRGIELPLRVPFLAAQILALLLLWSVAREAYGSSVGLLALALGSASAVGIHFAGLVNYENPGLATGLLIVHFSLRWIRRSLRVDLVLAGAATALGAAVTFGPLAFLPGLCVVTWRRLGLRRAFTFAAVTGACGLVPLLLHHFAARAALEVSLTPDDSGILDRARMLFDPLIGGELSLGSWLAVQWRHAAEAHGTTIVVVTAVALALRSLRALSPALGARLAALEHPRRETRDLPLFAVLLSGAFLTLFAFYKHTGEPQWSFQLWWLPAFSLGGALGLHQLGGSLLRLRAGLSPLVLLTLGLALPGLGVQAAWRARTRGPDAAVPMPSATGDWIRNATPVGSFVLHDRRMGLNLAAGFYAWRTLWPSAALDDEQATRVAKLLGLGEQPRYWLSPAPGHPLELLAPAPPALADREPMRSDATWRIWRLDGSATEDF